MEPRTDMLPDASLTSGPVIEDPKIETPVEPVNPVEPVPPEVPPGDKTPENKLYAALQEERAKVKEERRLRIEAEQKLESAGTVGTVPFEEMSDEGRALHKEITSLREEVELGKVLAKYPDIERDEFDEFRVEYPRTKLENVAKLFRAEKGLIEPVPSRQGLERPTGGPKTAPAKKYTGEDISAMMKNDNRRFQRMVREGKIRAEDIESEA